MYPCIDMKKRWDARLLYYTFKLIDLIEHFMYVQPYIFSIHIVNVYKFFIKCHDWRASYFFNEKLSNRQFQVSK